MSFLIIQRRALLKNFILFKEVMVVMRVAIKWNKQDSMILSAIFAVIGLIVGIAMLAKKGNKK